MNDWKAELTTIASNNSKHYNKYNNDITSNHCKTGVKGCECESLNGLL